MIRSIKIVKKAGYWFLQMDSGAMIRSPYVELKDRNEVVAYAQRIFPDAKIILE